MVESRVVFHVSLPISTWAFLMRLERGKRTELVEKAIDKAIEKMGGLNGK